MLFIEKTEKYDCIRKNLKHAFTSPDFQWIPHATDYALNDMKTQKVNLTNEM